MKAYLLYGLPGSGKSTWASKQSAVIINRDSLRSMIYGKYDYREKDEPMILEMAQQLVEVAAYEGRDIVIDETGNNVYTRVKYVAMLRRCHYEVICVMFTTSTETCKTRRMLDNKGLPQDWSAIIDGMEKSRSKPLKDEGYDKIIKV